MVEEGSAGEYAPDQKSQIWGSCPYGKQKEGDGESQEERIGKTAYLRIVKYGTRGGRHAETLRRKKGGAAARPKPVRAQTTQGKNCRRDRRD